MKLTRNHLIILIIMVTEVLGFSLILPFLPLYAQEMGASPFMVGMLLTTFSLFQFVSAPIMGRLSDIYGRKPLLIISQLSTLASFLILAFSHSLWMLYLSRAVDGLLGSNGTIAQAYLSDISDKKNRSKAFGISGVAFGIGFMIGPAIGGFLSQFGYNLPAYIAAFVSFLSIILTILILPETVKKQREVKFSFTIIDVKGFKDFWAQKKVRQQLLEFATYAFAQILFTSNFAIYTNKKIGVTSQDIGYALTYVGAITIIIRGFLIPRLIDKFGEKTLEKIGVISMIIGLFGLSIITQWNQIYLVITFFALGTALVRPLMMGDISRSVDDKKQGAILGIAGSVNSTAQIIGPLVGGTLLTYCFPNSVVYLAASLMVVGLILVIKEGNKR
ncbi:MAG: MFS transporter [Patescibacteria group bacterium]|nr:MFS transporter [Patescibacteria group bacterium]